MLGGTRNGIPGALGPAAVGFRREILIPAAADLRLRREQAAGDDDCRKERTFGVYVRLGELIHRFCLMTELLVVSWGKHSDPTENHPSLSAVFSSGKPEDASVDLTSDDGSEFCYN